ncbi:MAG: succinate dehydrogenase, cytochrome b556 subunit [Candidatus Eisenbacteria bacterium]|uniref:Succinate dehydrogenase, cytochrome b556 subunit n=1 Tax=Eiseniibacteriota bacterium TaxID=2212470 RepID=A0A937XCM1_UNCEI|nr:succinate dehydrogenase, cytochrome b556 subunit [Candidatus Eisenbacteria bacterium]
MMYRWHAGYVAWLLNRITGILITLYLVLHIWVVHHLAHGPREYKQVMDFLGSKVFMFFELGLIGVVLYHMMNGIRIVLADFAGVVKPQKTVFWAAMGLGVILYLLCAWELAGLFLGLTRAPAHAALTRAL